MSLTCGIKNKKVWSLSNMINCFIENCTIIDVYDASENNGVYGKSRLFDS